MLKNKKILFIVLVLLISILALSSDVFANVEIVVDNETVVLPDIPENVKGKKYFIGKSKYTQYDGDFFLCFYQGEEEYSFHYNLTGDKKVHILDKDKNNLTMSRYIYYKSNGTWQDLGTRPDQSIIGGNVYYSNSNIYNADGSIFFQVALPRAILMTPMEVEEIPTLITKLLIILVPIGLTIFGALLLVYLLHSKNWLHL